MICLSDNRSELNNSQMNTVLKQLGIKHIFSNPYSPQGNFCIENAHNFFKRMLSFYLAQMQNGIRSYHLPATVSTQPLHLTIWKAHFPSPQERPTRRLPWIAWERYYKIFRQ